MREKGFCDELRQGLFMRMKQHTCVAVQEEVEAPGVLEVSASGSTVADAAAGPGAAATFEPEPSSEQVRIAAALIYFMRTLPEFSLTPAEENTCRWQWAPWKQPQGPAQWQRRLPAQQPRQSTKQRPPADRSPLTPSCCRKGMASACVLACAEHATCCAGDTQHQCSTGALSGAAAGCGAAGAGGSAYRGLLPLHTRVHRWGPADTLLT